MLSLRSNHTLSRQFAKYTSLSLGTCALASAQSNAEVIQLDLSNLGSNNQNITGYNGGIPFGISNTVNQVLGVGSGNWTVLWTNTPAKGIGGNGSTMNFFVDSLSYNATPHNFTSNAFIGSTIATPKSNNNDKSCFEYGNYLAPSFNANRYLGFYDSGVNKYGWLEATWDGSTGTFEFISGAYENVAGRGILAGSLVSVPEPGTLTLGSLALLAGGGAAVRRHRKQRHQQATIPTAEPAAERAESAPVS